MLSACETSEEIGASSLLLSLDYLGVTLGALRGLAVIDLSLVIDAHRAVLVEKPPAPALIHDDAIL